MYNKKNWEKNIVDKFKSWRNPLKKNILKVKKDFEERLLEVKVGLEKNEI